MPAEVKTKNSIQRKKRKHKDLKQGSNCLQKRHQDKHKEGTEDFPGQWLDFTLPGAGAWVQSPGQRTTSHMLQLRV